MQAAELALLNSPKESNLCIVSDNKTIVDTINNDNKGKKKIGH